MAEHRELRVALKEARRWVVKIGSRSIIGEPGAGMRFDRLAEEISMLRGGGREVVVVSSGAVALGCQRLGLHPRPRALPRLQAAAAAGQSMLMDAYEAAFGRFRITVGQVLLNHSDVEDRDRFLNARAALDALLELGTVPIVNGNDTVAVDETRFGDNDQLAAIVATLIGADLLVLMTNVEGLLDEAGERVPLVQDLKTVEHLVRPEKSAEGLGGMESKLQSAFRATKRGVPVVLADARDPEVLLRVAGGDDVGTLFLPQGAPLPSRKHWIAYALKPRGSIVIDAGALAAIGEGKKSLLPAGILGVRGDFDPGDAVRILGPSGDEVARGLVRYGLRDVARLAGGRSHEIEARTGHHAGDVIVHRDDLVMI